MFEPKVDAKCTPEFLVAMLRWGDAYEISSSDESQLNSATGMEGSPSIFRFWLLQPQHLETPPVRPAVRRAEMQPIAAGALPPFSLPPTTVGRRQGRRGSRVVAWDPSAAGGAPGRQIPGPSRLLLLSVGSLWLRRLQQQDAP